ncbi:hypothetical protein HK103_002526 [Boothiomyces macroporosus]|uniref:Protein kinase domain-containing protein n=1 Tax=Boothiomyces macroporosus TaxID=261099 RepID=A0AAD5UIT5_9FUNG|nr:hypothetical protein HK103_002526 [Boothiomyces macroporosus]
MDLFQYARIEPYPCTDFEDENFEIEVKKRAYAIWEGKVVNGDPNADDQIANYYQALVQYRRDLSPETIIADRVPTPVDHFHIDLANPLQGGTFSVFNATHRFAPIALVAKVYPGLYNQERRNYAIAEINSNFRTRQYDWMPLCQFRSWSYDSDRCLLWLFFKRIDGQVLCRDIAIDFDFDQRTLWLKTLIFALASSHICGVFHQDISDLGTEGNVNVMIDNDRQLFLIDFNDANIPNTDEEAISNFGRDREGLNNFIDDHLFVNDVPPEIISLINNQNPLTLNECKQCLWNILKNDGYKFPHGVGGLLQILNN